MYIIAIAQNRASNTIIICESRVMVCLVMGKSPFKFIWLPNIPFASFSSLFWVLWLPLCGPCHRCVSLCRLGPLVPAQWLKSASKGRGRHTHTHTHKHEMSFREEVKKRGEGQWREEGGERHRGQQWWWAGGEKHGCPSLHPGPLPHSPHPSYGTVYLLMTGRGKGHSSVLIIIVFICSISNLPNRNGITERDDESLHWVYSGSNAEISLS